MRARSPALHPRDARGSDLQALPYDEKERGGTWERDREREVEWLHERETDWAQEPERERDREREREWERERERERERGRQVNNDLNGVHPSRKGEPPNGHVSVGFPVLTLSPQR